MYEFVLVLLPWLRWEYMVWMLSPKLIVFTLLVTCELFWSVFMFCSKARPLTRNYFLIGWSRSSVGDTACLILKMRTAPQRHRRQQRADRSLGGNINTSAVAPKMGRNCWPLIPSAQTPFLSWMASDYIVFGSQATKLPRWFVFGSRKSCYFDKFINGGRKADHRVWCVYAAVKKQLITRVPKALVHPASCTQCTGCVAQLGEDTQQAGFKQAKSDQCVEKMRVVQSWAVYVWLVVPEL